MTGRAARQLLADYQPKIEKLIRAFFAQEKQEAKKIDPFLYHNVVALEELVCRYGKRLRPVLTICAYQAAGGKNIAAVEKASVAIELFHNFLLIHDDVIDQDLMRHQGPAVQEVYRRYHRQHRLVGDSEHFGESIAIVLGDILASYCYRILIESGFPVKQRHAVLLRMSRVTQEVGYGQNFDILAGARRLVTEKEVLRIHYYKTAKYTIENPLLVGGIFGGMKLASLKQLARYALPLGTAFQIQDDILGMFADEQKLGKPVGSDLREGKQTLLVTWVFHHGTAAQKRRFRQLLGKPNLTVREIADARTIIVKTGALEHSRRLASQYAAVAKRIMHHSSLRGRGKEFLEGIAAYIIEREL